MKAKLNLELFKSERSRIIFIFLINIVQKIEINLYKNKKTFTFIYKFYNFFDQSDTIPVNY